jgi:hypothetical protein
VKYRKQQIVSRCHEADWSARKSRKNKKIKINASFILRT